MCEMLWSDPKPGDGRGPSQRGVGVGFGPDVTRSFLEDNQLDLLVRSHEVSRSCACLACLFHPPAAAQPLSSTVGALAWLPSPLCCVLLVLATIL